MSGRDVATMQEALEDLFQQLMAHRYVTGINADELRQLDEDALLHYMMELREQLAEVGALLGPVSAIHKRLIADRDTLKTQISLLQSVMRALSNL